MEVLYENIGRKIMVLAMVTAIAGAVVSLLLGAVMCAGGTDSGMIAGVICVIFGPIGSWISSFLLYGFGKHIDDVQAIRKEVEKNTNNR